MGKGDRSANLRATRTQINNASTSAQTRAFKARQLAKQKRDAEERKLRAIQAAEKEQREKKARDAGASDSPGDAPADAKPPTDRPPA